MSWKIALGLYFILWWIIIFAVLPWGITSQHETDDVVQGSDPGAPIQPLLMKKVLWTSVITAIIVGALYALVYFQLLTF